MENFTYFDLIFFGVVLISAIVGLVTGLVKELITLVASLGALGVTFLAYRVFGAGFSEQLASFGSKFDLVFVIYAAVAIASYIVFAMLFSMFTGSANKPESVSFVDNSLGLAIGIARGLAIGVFFVFFLDVFVTRDRVPAFITKSASYPYLLKGSDMVLKAYLPVRPVSSVESVPPAPVATVDPVESLPPAPPAPPVPPVSPAREEEVETILEATE